MSPVEDALYEGLRHRKWVLPAKTDADSIRAERWVYCVGDAPYAVSFTVYTGRYTEDRASYNRAPEGWDVSSHRERGRHGGCLCLSGAACHSEGSGIAASEWYAEAGGGGFVSDERVFAYLREMYEAWRHEGPTAQEEKETT